MSINLKEIDSKMNQLNRFKMSTPEHEEEKIHSRESLLSIAGAIPGLTKVSPGLTINTNLKTKGIDVSWFGTDIGILPTLHTQEEIKSKLQRSRDELQIKTKKAIESGEYQKALDARDRLLGRLVAGDIVTNIHNPIPVQQIQEQVKTIPGARVVSEPTNSVSPASITRAPETPNSGSGTPRLVIRTPPSAATPTSARHRLLLPAGNDISVYRTQITNLELCIRDKFGEMEIGEKLSPLCDKYRIDTTIDGRPLYEYDEDIAIWTRGTQIGDVGRWVYEYLRAFLDDRKEACKEFIEQRQPREELDQIQMQALVRVERDLAVIETRLDEINDTTWCSKTATVLLSHIYTISKYEKFGDKLEGNRLIFGVGNKMVLDLSTCDIRPRVKEDYCLMFTDIKYDPSASFENFEQFLMKLMCYDALMRNIFAECWVYSMSGHTILEVYMMMIGRPDCGKTSLMEVMETFFGTYAQPISKTLYLDEKNPTRGPNAEYIATKYVRLGYTPELRENDYFASDKMNRLATGEKDPARGLFTNQLQYFKPRMKGWFHSNYIPKMPLDEAAVKRFILFVMEHKFSLNPDPERKEYESLIVKGYHQQFMTPEGLSGILNWTIQELRRFNKQGRILSPIPEKMKAALKEEADARDPVEQWLQTECDLSDPTARLDLKLAVSSYNNYARFRRKKVYEVAGMFSRAMSAKGYKTKHTGLLYYFTGIKVKTPIDAVTGNPTTSLMNDLLRQ